MRLLRCISLYIGSAIDLFACTGAVLVLGQRCAVVYSVSTSHHRLYLLRCHAPALHSPYVGLLAAMGARHAYVHVYVNINQPSQHVCKWNVAR